MNEFSKLLSAINNLNGIIHEYDTTHKLDALNPAEVNGLRDAAKYLQWYYDVLNMWNRGNEK